MPPVFSASLITRGLLLLILAAGIYFFHGFLVPGLAALIIGFATWPLYRRLVVRCSGRTMLAASLAILVVLVVLVVPLSVAIHLEFIIYFSSAIDLQVLYNQKRSF